MPKLKYNPLSNSFEVASVNAILPQIMWHITDRCPLSCPYCFATKTNKDYPEAAINDAVELLRRLGVQKVDIGGGEPLVARALPRIVEALISANIAVTLTTSAFGLESNWQWVVANGNYFARIILSVDGSSGDEHDELRRGQGAYSQVLRMAECLHTSGYTRIRVNTVVTSGLLGADIHQLANTICAAHPSEWCLIQPHPENAKPAFPEFAVTSTTFAAFVERIRDTSSSGTWTIGKILSRRIEDYSGYWIIYPDQTIRRQTQGPDDFPSVNFVPSNYDAIASAVEQYGITLPKDGNTRL